MTPPYEPIPISKIVISTIKNEFTLNDIEAEVVYALALHYIRNHEDVNVKEMNKVLKEFVIKAKQMVKEAIECLKV